MATVQQINVLAARLVEHQAKFLPMATPDAQYVIRHTNDAIDLFIEAIRNRPEYDADCYPSWGPIDLDTIRDSDAFYKALKRSGLKVSQWAKDILGKPAFRLRMASEKKEINLVRVSVADLGFPNGAHHLDICNRAFKFNMRFCPAEVGPQLRLQYHDQPVGEKLRIIMEPIEGSEHLGRIDSFVFFVEHKKDEGPSLNAYAVSGFGSEYWRPDQECIFARYRK